MEKKRERQTNRKQMDGKQTEGQRDKQLMDGKKRETGNRWMEK